jgi:hypothetical protein
MFARQGKTIQLPDCIKLRGSPDSKEVMTLSFEEELYMREGLIPTVLGTAVTASGAAMRGKYPMAAAAVVGFGLAHVVLGAIDLVEHRKQRMF